jgi:hypothetical protein
MNEEPVGQPLTRGLFYTTTMNREDMVALLTNDYRRKISVHSYPA